MQCSPFAKHFSPFLTSPRLHKHLNCDTLGRCSIFGEVVVRGSQTSGYADLPDLIFADGSEPAARFCRVDFGGACAAVE